MTNVIDKGGKGTVQKKEKKKGGAPSAEEHKRGHRKLRKTKNQYFCQVTRTQHYSRREPWGAISREI